MEKEVKRTNVAGEAFEDLKEEQMVQVQGQGAVVADTKTIKPTNTISLTIGKISVVH